MIRVLIAVRGQPTLTCWRRNTWGDWTGPGRWPIATQRWEGLCRNRPSANCGYGCNRRELPTVAIVGSFEGASYGCMLWIHMNFRSYEFIMNSYDLKSCYERMEIMILLWIEGFGPLFVMIFATRLEIRHIWHLNWAYIVEHARRGLGMTCMGRFAWAVMLHGSHAWQQAMGFLWLTNHMNSYDLLWFIWIHNRLFRIHMNCPTIE